MSSRFLAHYEHVHWNAWATLLFFGVFLGILIWLFRKNSKTFYQHMSNSILETQWETESKSRNSNGK